ncbi:MAG: acyltransferase [Negativicutes bacterium]|nr:acyltransferase [Negativicutes bacterium]
MAVRRYQRYPVSGKNSLRFWPDAVSPLRVVWNFFILSLCRISPSFVLKNALYRMLGVQVGENASVGLMVMLDVFFPEEVEIGANVIIGYNTTVLGHEFLRDEWRKGKVVIEKDVVIGANCTLLPGVIVGEGAVVSAMSLINSDIPPHSFYGGVPARNLKAGEV